MANRVKWFTRNQSTELITSQVDAVDLKALERELTFIKRNIGNDSLPELQKVVNIFVKLKRIIKILDQLKEDPE